MFKKSWKLKEDFLNGLASALEKDDKGKKANIATERQHSLFRCLVAINQKNQDL